jgi:hypothetical protein
VKQTKSRGKDSEELPKDTGNIWKAKALHRQKEIQVLRKRIKELEQSRNLWRGKYSDTKSRETTALFGGSKAVGHQYSLLLVWLVLGWQRYGAMSFRSCRHCLFHLCFVLGLSRRLPCASTIRLWVCKCGYYRVASVEFKQEEYVIYVDESIVIGGQKILLVLGCPLSTFSTDYSVDMSKCKVLWVDSGNSWLGRDIAQILSQVSVGHIISYVVSDCGTNLVSAYNSCSYTHIKDCTHSIANILKSLYEPDECFQDFSKKAMELRKLWFLSKEKSIYLPPSQRGKVRFANIFSLVKWADNLLNCWITLPQTIQTALAFLQVHKALIGELIRIEKTVSTTCTILKNKGFSRANKARIEAQLVAKNTNITEHIFENKLKEYLVNLEKQRQDLGQETILCCSDIIESFFGKIKNKFANNTPKKMTEFLYSMANFGADFTEDEIKNALESVRVCDLKNKIKHK